MTVFSSRRSLKQIATDAIYIMIFSYLILYSILNTLFVDLPVHSDGGQIYSYDIKNIVFNTIDCSFPISSQYQKTPRCICYLLLVFTVTIRNRKWLAAGAAASLLSYSGVAAIHSLVLFATNNRLHLPLAKTRCQSIPTPGSDTPFFACAGVLDPDVSMIVHILSSVMLGALPMAAWSTTFKKSASKAVLIFWLLLLAVGHMFYPITFSNQNYHFQICPKGYVEPLPRANFQAPLLDDAWSDSFQSLVSVSQQASVPFENGSIPACLYSCFATTDYVGRSSQDIGVFPSNTPNIFVKGPSEARLAIILFWWAYAFLALLTLFTTEKQGRLPKWVRKGVCSVEYRQPSWMSILQSKINKHHASNIVNKGQRRSFGDTKASPRPMKHIQITALELIQFITQFSSLAAFVGCTLYDELPAAGQQEAFLEQEPFAAVGQWSCVAVVILVLFAAVVSRIWASDERGGDEESMSMEEMNWRIGHAW